MNIWPFPIYCQKVSHTVPLAEAFCHLFPEFFALQQMLPRNKYHILLNYTYNEFIFLDLIFMTEEKSIYLSLCLSI
jgi:hypothetical protein